MKRFEKVKIFEDPITCKKLEGIAELRRRRRESYELEGCELWEVFFRSDGMNVLRKINIKNH